MAGVCGSNSTITTGLLAHCVGWELRECSSGAAGTTIIKGKPQCVSLGSARKPVRSGRHAMTTHAQHVDSGDATCGCPAVGSYKYSRCTVLQSLYILGSGRVRSFLVYPVPDRWDVRGKVDKYLD